MRVTKRSGEGDWRGYYIQPDELEQIRAIWNSSGAPKLSGDARLRLLQILKNHEAKQRTNHRLCEHTPLSQRSIGVASPPYADPHIGPLQLRGRQQPLYVSQLLLALV